MGKRAGAACQRSQPHAGEGGLVKGNGRAKGWRGPKAWGPGGYGCPDCGPFCFRVPARGAVSVTGPFGISGGGRGSGREHANSTQRFLKRKSDGAKPDPRKKNAFIEMGKKKDKDMHGVAPASHPAPLRRGVKGPEQNTQNPTGVKRGCCFPRFGPGSKVPVAPRGARGPPTPVTAPPILVSFPPGPAFGGVGRS